MTPRRNQPRSPRSPKAGRTPVEKTLPPRVQRRRKTAHGAVRKDSMLLEASEGPRILWGRTKPKIKKG